MKELIAYDDAVDLLDADHKAVKKMFIDHASLVENGAPAAEKRLLAGRICAALTVHAQIEEEIFYPQVRKAIGDHVLMDEALREHAAAKEDIARIASMNPGDPEQDAAVRQLGVLIGKHVLQERERVFLKARQAPLDLRGLTLPLLKRKRQLQHKASAMPAKVAA